MEAHVISFFQKIQVSALCWKAYVEVFWDSQGPILEHYMEKGVTVTSVNYCNMLRNEVRPAIRSKRRGRLTQGFLLLHDNARPHTAHLTITTIRQLNWEVLEHPATAQTWHLHISICLDPSRTH